MAQYKCKICGYVLDEDNYEEGLNIPAGTKFEDLPSSFNVRNAEWQSQCLKKFK